jgi:ribosomal protein L16/L10AE
MVADVKIGKMLLRLAHVPGDSLLEALRTAGEIVPRLPQVVRLIPRDLHLRG